MLHNAVKSQGRFYPVGILSIFAGFSAVKRDFIVLHQDLNKQANTVNQSAAVTAHL